MMMVRLQALFRNSDVSCLLTALQLYWDTPPKITRTLAARSMEIFGQGPVAGFGCWYLCRNPWSEVRTHDDGE